MRISRLIAGLAFLSLSTAIHATGTGDAPEQGSSGPARVMVLGTYHFANPGRDVMNTRAGDILSEEKQAEVEAVADALAAFRPTKVLVEARDQAEVDREYGAYRRGDRELEANESEQLGYRLAKRMNLESVQAVDLPGEFPFDEVMAYAQENDPGFVKNFKAFRQRFESHYKTLPQRHSVGEALRIMNEPVTLRELNALYPMIAEVGAGDNWVGADLVTGWHSRNIRIYTNIAAHTEPGDRVLVIYGAGHKATLDYMINHAAGMVPVSPLDFL